MNKLKIRRNKYKKRYEKLKEVVKTLDNNISKDKLKERIKELDIEFYRLDKSINITEKNITEEKYYQARENIAVMQTIGWARGLFEELLEESDK